MELTFETWMSQVDQLVARETGLGTRDLPDIEYRDRYDDDVDPKAVAAEVLRAAGWPDHDIPVDWLEEE